MKTEQAIREEIDWLQRAADAARVGLMERRLAICAIHALQWTIKERKESTPPRVYDYNPLDC